MTEGRSVPPHRARVVFLLEELKFGGTQRQTIELATYLDRNRYCAEICCMAFGDDMEPIARRRDIPITWLSRRKSVGPENVLKLWRFLKSRRIDLLVLLTVIPNIWGRVLGRMVKCPAIVGTCRQSGGPLRQHDWLLWPLADHHICNAEDLKRTLTTSFGVPASRVSVIPNSVDTEFFTPGPSFREGDGPVILCVARLVPDKDHNTLIAAFKLLAKEYPRAELWVVGNGPRRDAIGRMVADNSLDGRVKLIPGQEDLRPFFRQSTMLVLSSVHEGLPNVVLEAMASGLPVVATDVAGLSEVVMSGETGWLVPEKNPEALAEAIGRVLSDAEMQESFGRAGRERAVKRYSISGMVRGHEAVFERLLNRKA